MILSDMYNYRYDEDKDMYFEYEKQCPNCLKIFTFDEYKKGRDYAPYLIERDWEKIKFCSNKCGYIYSTIKYQKQKRRKMISDLAGGNPVCSRCGYSETVDIHHIRPHYKGGSDNKNNLIILCPNCHALVHRHIISDHEIKELKGRILMGFEEGK